MPNVRRGKLGMSRCCESRSTSTTCAVHCAKSAAARRGPAVAHDDTVVLAPTVSPSYHEITMVRNGAPLVLIVEDDVETRRFYSDVFVRSGFEVDQAHNGFQAL